jgi:anaerobic selenocysteine-containing dehydrogenase
MTETVKWADVVLPATTGYEKTDLTATPLHPFLQLQQAAIAPVGESRSELWMWREIVRRIDPAKAAEFFEKDEWEAIEAILQAGDVPGGPTEGITLEQLKAGPVRLPVPDPDIPFLDQIRDLAPFPPRSLPAPLAATAAFIPTRRIEFYKEEERFRELGEEVPVYRPPHDDEVHDPATYPMALLSPHSKWRIHSSYANNAWLEELHGGRPEVFISPGDALARDIETGDQVRLWNTRGEVVAWAHVTPSEQPGSITLYEGWWPRQFARGKGVNELTSSEVNPIHEVHFVGNMWAPSTGWKDCRCDIEKVGDA